MLLFVIPCRFFWGILDLQCCNYCHLPNNVSSKFQSNMTIFHHRLPTREGRVLTNGWTHPPSPIYPPSTTICVYEFKRSVIRKVTIHSDMKYHMTLNIITSVVENNIKATQCQNRIPCFSCLAITIPCAMLRC